MHKAKTRNILNRLGNTGGSTAITIILVLETLHYLTVTVVTSSYSYFPPKGTTESDGNDDGDDLVESVFNKHEPLPGTIAAFQAQFLDNEAPRQQFRLSRVDDKADVAMDVMGIYKNPNLNFRATPRVRFEEENAVGDGPARELLEIAISILEEGVPGRHNKPIVFLEGEPDHKLPIKDQSLRLTGAFKAVGRMIGHSLLHGGRGPSGLSIAVKQYLSGTVKDGTPPTLELSDIPDVDLRAIIQEVRLGSLWSSKHFFLVGCSIVY